VRKASNVVGSRALDSQQKEIWTVEINEAENDKEKRRG